MVLVSCCLVLPLGCATPSRAEPARPTASVTGPSTTPGSFVPAATEAPRSPLTIAPITSAPAPSSSPPEAQAVNGLPSTTVVLERAPIESLELRVVTVASAVPSAPPATKHFVDVTSGLPNGCAHFYGYELVRSDSTITVTVWNTMPADIRAACTMQYAVTAHAIPVGTNLVPGRRYTLQINDKEATFETR